MHVYQDSRCPNKTKIVLSYFKTPGLLFSEYNFICGMHSWGYQLCNVYGIKTESDVYPDNRPKDLMIWLQFHVEEGFISGERKIIMTALSSRRAYTRKNTFASCKRWTNVKFIQFSVERYCKVCKE